jgi:[acyl-carrier-protein] S-malonyltransferase
MRSAGEGLKEGLDRASIRDASIPVYTNVAAEPITRANEIRDFLYRQLTSPVRWEQTIRNMVRDGATRFVEIGPGKVLQGLVRRTESAVQVGGIDKLSDISALEA